MTEIPRRFLTPAAIGEIRRNTDWPQLLAALGINSDRRRSKAGDIWAHSPFSADAEASFHVTDKGWYCFSTNQGGGALELVQRTQNITCFEASRWLLDNGLSSYTEEDRPAELPTEEPETDSPANRPIRHDLLPLLTPAHPELARRGISPETCAYLGCGYLPEGGRSPLAGRIVFQVRGVRGGEPVILSHIGRALSAEQEEAGGEMAPLPRFRENPRTLQHRPAPPWGHCTKVRSMYAR